MVFQDVEKSGTAAGGTVSVNSDYMRGIAMLIHVKPASTTTAYEYKIIDPKSRTIRYVYDKVGEFADTEPLPVWGICTLQILNASANEKFEWLIRVKELER